MKVDFLPASERPNVVQNEVFELHSLTHFCLDQPQQLRPNVTAVTGRYVLMIEKEIKHLSQEIFLEPLPFSMFEELPQQEWVAAHGVPQRCVGDNDFVMLS
jgi:hypothetical protein